MLQSENKKFFEFIVNSILFLNLFIYLSCGDAQIFRNIKDSKNEEWGGALIALKTDSLKLLSGSAEKIVISAHKYINGEFQNDPTSKKEIVVEEGKSDYDTLIELKLGKFKFIAEVYNTSGEVIGSSSVEKEIVTSGEIVEFEMVININEIDDIYEADISATAHGTLTINNAPVVEIDTTKVFISETDDQIMVSFTESAIKMSSDDKTYYYGYLSICEGYIQDSRNSKVTVNVDANTTLVYESLVQDHITVFFNKTMVPIYNEPSDLEFDSIYDFTWCGVKVFAGDSYGAESSATLKFYTNDLL